MTSDPRSADSAGSEPGASSATITSPSTRTSIGVAPVDETTVPPLISSDIGSSSPSAGRAADRNPPAERLQEPCHTSRAPWAQRFPRDLTTLRGRSDMYTMVLDGEPHWAPLERLAD